MVLGVRKKIRYIDFVSFWCKDNNKWRSARRVRDLHSLLSIYFTFFRCKMESQLMEVIRHYNPHIIGFLHGLYCIETIAQKFFCPPSVYRCLSVCICILLWNFFAIFVSIWDKNVILTRCFIVFSVYVQILVFVCRSSGIEASQI